jgi:hypothetical protein
MAFNDLPRHLRDLLEDHIDKAIKLRLATRTKDQAVQKLTSHVANGTFPKSLRFKAELQVPASISTPTLMTEALGLRSEMATALQTFQRQSTDIILRLARLSMQEAEGKRTAHLASVDQEIIAFHKILHAKHSNPSAAILEQQLSNFNYAQIHNYPRDDPVVTTCLNAIATWRQECQARWDELLASETLSEVKRNRSKTATIAAESMLLEDSANTTVLALIRKELKPLRDEINRRLHPKKAERAPSASKQKTTSVHSRSRSPQPRKPKPMTKTSSRSPSATRPHPRGRSAEAGRGVARGLRNSRGDAGGTPAPRGSKSPSRQDHRTARPRKKATSGSRSRSPSASRGRPRGHRG